MVSAASELFTELSEPELLVGSRVVSDSILARLSWRHCYFLDAMLHYFATYPDRSVASVARVHFLFILLLFLRANRKFYTRDWAIGLSR